MNAYRASILLAAASALTLGACKPNLTTQPYSQANLDFTRYVAVGNSLTAGYADNSLYRSGQIASYPAMLSWSFSRFGPSDYKAPLLPGESGWPSPKLVLGLSPDLMGNVSLGPVPYPNQTDTVGSSINIAAQGPYNNMGVPGIRAIDFLNPFYGLLNPYASRFFASPNPLEEMGRIHPTFFTLWLGNNDVLGYATSGGMGKSSGGSPFSLADQSAISGTDYFAAGIDSALGRLMQDSTAHGAIINIPDVTSIPFFKTVPYNGLELTRQTQVDSLNAAYAPLGISFTLGANPFIIADDAVPVIHLRPAKEGELILLTVPQDSLRYAGWGSKKPIPDRYVLDGGEIKAVQDASAIFNGILRSRAEQYGLAFVDMNSFLKSLATGMKYRGVDFTTEFVTGGLFSLDGVHLTPRGYAIVANEILRSINDYYGAGLPMIDVNAYSGIRIP
jgi:lysophospholipase L1-like esterase